MVRRALQTASAKPTMPKSSVKVEVDAQVLLRIAKHAKQNFPHSASGSLLGMDSAAANEVKVSNCFAYRRKEGEDSERATKEFEEYQYNILQALSEVRIDANAVGWYESTHLGNFLNEGFIESQYTFQKAVPNAVCVVYDDFQQRVDGCGFRAFRLTAQAMRKRDQGEDSEDAFAEFSSSDLLEEVPISIHTSPYTEQLLLQWTAEGKESQGIDVNVVTPALERNVQLLLDTLDEFSLQQREMQMYERQTRQNKEKMAKNARAPKSIDTLNLSKQIQEHCKNLNTFGNDSLSKLYMAGNKKQEDSDIARVLESFQE